MIYATRVRCMEHAINLAAAHFTKAITSTTSSQVDEDLEDDISNTSDALSKALALIAQVRKSPQAQAFICRSCTETNVPVLELVQWVCTRWASLFTCLDRLLLLWKVADDEQGVNRFVHLVDDSDEVPKLRKWQYADFKLTNSDWLQLSLIHEALQEPADATQSFSSSKHPTVWRVIPVLEFLQQSWKNMVADEKFLSISDALEAGLENLDKWTQKTDDTDAYFICLVLDLNYKLEYAQSQWNDDAFNEGVKKLEAGLSSCHIGLHAS
ncbi:ribonuclease H-like domain-containing protein [Suillus americanus]|nr:ribonuclease H-like domain-containing protein [Suillus americanus]